MTSGFMIAAPKSGSGKTTVTLGLLRALARRGLKVGSFKCGPDYIDPAFHKIATGRSSYNLDSWTMPAQLMDNNFVYGTKNTDIIIAEGSMGLFDAVANTGASGDGASADIASRYGLPVILVMDCSGQSQSTGAVALGFHNFRPDIKIAGVVLGNIASERHRMLAAKGVERAGIKVFGALPRGGVPAIPERHLGLVQAGEIDGIDKMIDELADAMEKFLDIDAILSTCYPILYRASSKAPNLIPAFLGMKIALTKDIAFSFMYEHILADWNEQGVKILPFSPLADESPDMDADLCWLAGGYPELYAEKLSGNKNFLNGLRNFAQKKPVHGECGGFMVLGEEMIAADGKSWQMAGLLPITTSFAQRKLHLGYRTLHLACDLPIGAKNSLVRGHEFHYATIVRQGEAEPIGEATDANGISLGSAGIKKGNASGTFFHMVASD